MMILADTYSSLREPRMPRTAHSLPSVQAITRWPTWRLVERWHGYVSMRSPECLASTKSEARAKFKAMLGEVPTGAKIERAA